MRVDSATLVLALAAGALLWIGRSTRIDPSRVNSTCAWSGDTSVPVRWQNAAGREHLVRDAQLAEDLAIRYADTEHKRRFGYQGHGGLINHGQLVNECMASLAAAIERNHGVTAEEVQRARGQRSVAFDTAVAVVFSLAYCFGVSIVARRLRIRFANDARAIRAAAIALVSVPTAALGVVLGQIWSMVWESFRVGNDHMSMFRAATPLSPWNQHGGAVWVLAIVLFWIAALWPSPEWRAVQEH